MEGVTTMSLSHRRPNRQVFVTSRAVALIRAKDVGYRRGLAKKFSLTTSSVHQIETQNHRQTLQRPPLALKSRAVRCGRGSVFGFQIHLPSKKELRIITTATKARHCFPLRKAFELPSESLSR